MKQPLTLAPLFMSILTGFLSTVAVAEPQPIDTRKSTLIVRVYRAGVFSAFGHDHEIEAPVASGSVDMVAHQVELRVSAANLRVRDSDASEKDRAEIQRQMVGPEVLDAARFPEILFRSTAAESAGRGAWKLRGNLTLRGTSRLVDVTVSETGGHYTGNAALRQTEFGIRPIRIAGGAVRVKDEVRIEFDIQLAH